MNSLRTSQAFNARRIRVAALLAAGAMAMAACGGDDESDSSGSGSTSSGAATTQSASTGTEAVKASCEAVATAEAPLEFTGPEGGWDVASAEGKKVAWINFGTSETGVEMTAGAVEASKELGFEIAEFDGKFDPAEWNKGMQQAVDRKVDAIALFAIDPNLVGESMAAAKEAGIPVIYVLGPDPVEPFANEDAGVSFPFADAGTMIANYAMCANDGKIDGQIITDTTYPNSAAMQDAAQAVFENCEDCKFKESNLPLATWPQKVSTTVKTAITGNPNLNFVWPLYDFGAPFAAQAIGEAGATDRIKLAAVNGDDPSLKLVCDGGQSASAAMPTSWLGWAAADQIGRVMSGAEAVDQKIPVRLMTENSLDCPVLDQDERFGGADFRAGYQALWSEGA